MKHIFIPLLLLSLNLTSTTSFAQFQSTSFSVSKNDLELNHYEADSTANALVIYEEGNSYIDKETFKLVTKIKRKVKIFNKKGFEQATLEIYLFKNKNNQEKIKDIIATTYNLIDNQVKTAKLNKNQIFNENSNSNSDIVKFTLPNIQEGSVIAYSYTLTSPFIYKYKEWNFQEFIPKLYSVYDTSIPAIYDYNIKLVGEQKLDESTIDIKRDCILVGNEASADCSVSKYVMKNIPAFVEEKYMTSEKNYISRIEYELNTIKRFDGTTDKISKTWKDADKEIKLMPSIGKQLNKKTNLKGLFSDLDINSDDPLSKPKAIYKYIQNNYAWNNKHAIFKEVSLKNLLGNKSGNATEINILLHNLLKENGFDVKPVLLSTRENGLPTKLYPVISEFNYLIVELVLDNNYFYLDATDKYLFFGQLPFKCLNEYGRVLDFKNGSYWTSIIEKKSSLVQHQVILNISEENHLKGKINSRYSGYHALKHKKKYYHNPDTYLEDIQENQLNIEVLDHQILESENDDTFKETFNIILNEDNIIADKIYFDPFIYKFFTKNPFKLQQRNYPIDFGFKDSYLYSFELDIGDKYEITEIPENIIVRLPNDSGLFSFSNTIEGTKLSLSFKIIFKKSKYAYNYYEYLKKFMSKVVDVQNNSLIVLKKK